MDLAALILTCSLYPDDALVRALARVEAHDNPLHVADARMRRAPVYPADLAEAAAELQALRADPDSDPLVGLLAVPAREAARFGRGPADMLDPCVNIGVGSALLLELSERCAHPPASPDADAPPTRRACVARAYERLTGLAGLAGALSSALDFDLRQVQSQPPERRPRPRPDTAPVASATDSPDGWSSEQLFFDLEPTAAPARPADAGPARETATSQAAAGGARAAADAGPPALSTQLEIREPRESGRPAQPAREPRK